MKYNESRENYLVSILILKKKKGNVRSIDIANFLGYSRASVSNALSLLKCNDYITIDDSGLISFTDIGKAKAEDIYHKSMTVYKYLTEVLGVSEDTAREDAKKIDHVISGETVSKMNDVLKSLG